MDESFKILGIEDLSSKSIQRLEWYVQQEKIRRWIRNAEICVRVLFAEERKLSEQIFKGLGKIDVDDVCFMESVSYHAILLFNFVEAISNGRKSPDKLFKILDLYNVMSNLLVDVNIVFQSKLGESVRKKVVDIRFGLCEAARTTLSEFEKAVIGEPTKVLMAGGSIHLLNKTVMNYIDSMVDYKQSLIELIVSKPSTTSSGMELDSSEFEGKANSPLVLHLLWIIKILKVNLKAKSEHYKDAGLAHFFMMNNVHYIVHKIKGSFELREMIGEEFVNRLTVEYNLAANLYRKASWKRVLDCLRKDGLDKLGSFFSGSVSMFVSRQRFKAFDAKFKDVVAAQSAWFVADVHLREELRFSILQMLIPLHTLFLRRHRRNVEILKQSGNCIRFAEEDVEKAVMSLFEGVSE